MSTPSMLPDRALHRAGGIDEARGGDRAGRAVVRYLDAAHPPAAGVDAGDLAANQPDAVLAGLFEHIHAQLLGAEPAAAARVQQRHRVFGNIREVRADQRRVEQQIGAVGLVFEAVGGSGNVSCEDERPTTEDESSVAVDLAFVLRPSSFVFRPVNPQRPCPQRGGLLGGLAQQRGARGIGGGVEVAAPVELDAIVGGARDLFEQIDAAVHKGDHRIAGAGPPVAVGLGRFVAGQRQRRARLDQHDIAHALLDGQVICRSDAGDPGPADHDLGG